MPFELFVPFGIMLDDERATGKKLVNDIRSRRTAFGKGIKVIMSKWWLIFPILIVLVKLNILNPGGLLKVLSIGAIGSILDWSLFIEILPLLRWFPRIALSLDVFGGAVVWISATAIIMGITVLGALVMNSRYYLWRKFREE